MSYLREYEQLNKQQRLAVDTIDGPLLVMAGPGTGKTQLLSARIAHILQKTDTLPQNILCLTFTENGAQNMRDRLTKFIGKAAYDVNISTYHAFGGDLIRRYPEYFTETRLQDPIDELGRHQIVREIVEKMSYSNPLKQTRHHLGDLISTLSEVKRALLTSEQLRVIAKENQTFIQAANKQLLPVWSEFKRMPTKSSIAMPYFESTLEILQQLVPVTSAHPHFMSLAAIAVGELTNAIQIATTTEKTTQLTKWKNDWLAKDSANNFILAGELESRRITALADVYESYQLGLSLKGFYDFDDMIIRAIQALENNNDLRYTLQERYLYILLDEFQDTNTAQLRLVQLLSDNPVHEGRPNIMAVGDDDQAIYAFQGAQYSNMLDFYQMYRDVQVINLADNYRSHGDILLAAQNVSEQIEERLHHKFDDITKTLVAANTKLPGASTITRTDFLSDIAQYEWIASQIKKLINKGTSPKEIAVLAPKHKQIEPLVAYLNAHEIPVRYEKRENILEAPVINQLLHMSKLVLALQRGDEAMASSIWPEVLSYEFWKIPTSKIWEVSWKVSDNREQRLTWSKALLHDEICRMPALLFLTLANRADSETCEIMLDYMTGNQDIDSDEPDIKTLHSPLKDFYTSKAAMADDPGRFYTTLSHLKVLRTKLRDHQATSKQVLTLKDLLAFVAMYEAAEQRMLNTSPYNQQTDAVQLMTVFKAKGLEFDHVFLPCCQDEVWGGSSRGNNNKLSLPKNLSPIRHAGATDDERLRILFVAITRAKYGLRLTNYLQNYSGKSTKRLKYFEEQEQSDGTFSCMILPDDKRLVRYDDTTPPAMEHLELDWRAQHINSIAATQLRALLEYRIKTYKLSPTHLNTFTDMEYGGPDKFFMHTLLRFPQAPGVDGQYGNAIHETLEWLQMQIDMHGKLPNLASTIVNFKSQLKRKHLTLEQYALEAERGESALTIYLAHRSHIFKPEDKAEHGFAHEGVFVGNVHLSGKIDRMEIDKDKKTICVVDYKTGSSHDKWERSSKLHKYKRQLYCYKLLIEGSQTFAGYTVTSGRLEFIEPDKHGNIHSLELSFDKDELEKTIKLLQVMWDKVSSLDFPDTSSFSNDLKGMLAFEDALLDGTV